MKTKIMIFLALIVINGSFAWGHGKEAHQPKVTALKSELSPNLEYRSKAELWEFIDNTLITLAVEIKKTGSRTSKKELIRLKKALDEVRK